MFDVRVQKNYVGPTLSFDDFLVSQLRLNLTVRVLSDRKRKSDFPLLGKNPTTSLFDVPPYRDFVILVILFNFHGGISRKIRTEHGFLSSRDARRDPHRVGRSNRKRHLLGNSVRPKEFPSRLTSKELSLSRSMNCSRRRIVRKKKKHV